MTVPPMLQKLADLAVEAGEETLRIREGDMDLRHKADESPVTAADEAAEKVILAGLAELMPGVPIIAEEEAAAGRIPDISGTFLLVDPLDGTKSYIAGRDDFTVNIARIENGEPVTGVVFAPAKRWLLAGDREAGAYQSHDGGPLEPIIDNPAQNRAKLRAVASLNHRDAETDAWLAAHGITDVVAAGSSLKLCLLATGEADVYPRFGPTMEWDIAAGHAVLAATGGRVLVAETGEPLRYGKVDAGFLNPAFIAWATGISPR